MCRSWNLALLSLFCRSTDLKKFSRLPVQQKIKLPSLNRKPDNVDQGRSRMALRTVFKQHFDLLEETIDMPTTDRINLKNEPSSIFNCNESIRTGKVIILRRKKQAYTETKAMRDHITTNTCVHLQVGQFCPLILYFSRPWDGPDDALYFISPNGYMASELFIVSLTSCYKNTEHPRSETLDT